VPNDHMIDIERPPVVETAVIAKLVLPGETAETVDESVEEMERLAETAGAVVAGKLVQRRPKACPATLFGAGKVETLRSMCEETEASLVLVDSDLTPAQGANLEKALDRKVVDRTQLILDIFAQRAQTSEGKLQVELAQLNYILPRLTGRGSIMRQVGGIGVRGPGEQKLEVDRRVIRERMARIKRDLESVRKTRQTQRKRRIEESVGTVALVGYTNAGKSSLLNALTDAGVFVEDKLFATLDPRSRLVALPDGGEVVFTDTVGFIRNLPHTLVAAFRATLEEVTEADLLLLVVDAAHPAAAHHVGAVHDVLEEISAHEKPVVNVLNKADIAPLPYVNDLKRRLHDTVIVSARSGAGLAELLRSVQTHLAQKRRRVQLRIPQREAGVVAQVHRNGRVLRESYEGDDILIEAELDHALYGKLEPYTASRDPDEGR
jgi:GTPase